MALLVTVIAAAATSTAQPECWAVSLHMTQALTVIALLSLSSPG